MAFKHGPLLRLQVTWEASILLLGSKSVPPLAQLGPPLFQVVYVNEAISIFFSSFFFIYFLSCCSEIPRPSAETVRVVAAFLVINARSIHWKVDGLQFWPVEG